ncbi:MAG: PAS domain S-box protein [Bacteroidales bacterium]|nr:PAS domain S-box protein [Bacteroidales bacterium]
MEPLSKHNISDFSLSKRISKFGEDEKKLLRTLINSLPFQVWYIINNDVYWALNTAHANFHGKEVDEMESKKLCEIFSPEKVEFCNSMSKKVFESSGQVVIKEWLTNGTGEKRFMQITKTPKFNEKGEIELVVCTALDITDSKLAEERLSKSEEKYRTMTEKIQDVIYTLDIKGNIIEMSKSIEDFSGYKIEELIGKPVLNFYSDPDERAAFINAIREKGFVKNQELKLKTKNNKIMNVLASSHLIIDEQGNHIGTEGVLIDITKNKRLENIAKSKNKILTMVSKKENLQDIFNAIVYLIDEMNEVSTVLYIVDETGNNTDYYSSSFAKKTNPGINNISVLKSASRRDMPKRIFNLKDKESQEFFIVSDLEKLESDGYSSWIIQPIIDSKTNVIGAILSFSKTRESLENRLSSLFLWSADIAALAIENRKLSEQYQALFNEMRNGFVLFEIVRDSLSKIIDFKFLNMNPGFEMLTGFVCHETIGKSIGQVLPEKESNWRETFLSAIENNNYQLFEVFQFNKKQFFEVSSYFYTKNVLACIFSNITDRKNAEKQLHDTLIETERMNRLMVGREERIIELKQTINKMLIESGKKPIFNVD